MNTGILHGAAPKKRTNVRSVPPSVRGLRLYFRVASTVAPSVAERQAASIFLTPRRRKAADVARLPAGATMVHLNHDDIRITGWEWGIGLKPVVLLVHGWSGLASDFESIALALVDEGFRVVAFDMPAHGRSPGKHTTLVEFVRSLHAIERWCGGIAGVVGHSFGATAAILALEEGLRAPRAVIISPGPGPMHYLERIRRFIGLPAERVPGMIRRLVERVGRDIGHFEPTRAARAIEIPALVLHDPADREVPFDHVQAIVGEWRGSRLETREGVGHFRILSDRETGERVARWLVGG